MVDLQEPLPRNALDESRHAYRSEIEGLRAVAVLAVLLFHVGFPLSGGYIGVDVFFVISGFLITRNILREHQAGLFTFRRFYVRRIRRLFPALAVTLLATLAAGYLFFATDDMARLGQSALFAVASLSNVLFWQEIGYFDAAATLKPLLHTWSLAVEEQFYLLWPAVVVFAARLRGSRAVFGLIACIGIASFVSAELLRSGSPGAVFYLMPFRMFELCAGALLATLNPKAPRALGAQIATVAGLAAVLYSVAFFDANTSTRHFWSLLPCVGTVFVIFAGSNRVSTLLLANPIATFIGAISYSLYLVHWPVVVFHKYLWPAETPSTIKWLLVLLCVVLAAMLNRMVEQPFRSGSKADRSHVSARMASTACATLAMVVCATGWHAWASGGWPFRMPPELRGIPSEAALWAERNPQARVGTCFVYMPVETKFDEAKCLAPDSAKPNYLIFGDSFAADAYVYLSAAYPDVNFLQATAGSCMPLIGSHKDALCTTLHEQIFMPFVSRGGIDGVVLSAAWTPSDGDALEQTIDYLKTKVPRIVLVGSVVRFQNNVQSLIFQSRSKSVGEVEHFADSRIQVPEYQMNDLLRQRFRDKGVTYIDVQSLLCDDHCRLFTPDHRLIYIDWGHLTLDGSRFLARLISAQKQYAGVFSKSLTE